MDFITKTSLYLLHIILRLPVYQYVKRINPRLFRFFIHHECKRIVFLCNFYPLRSPHLAEGARRCRCRLPAR